MEIKRNWILVITKVAIDIGLCLLIIGTCLTLFTLTKGAINRSYTHLSVPVEFKVQTLERYYPTHHVNDADIIMQALDGVAIVQVIDKPGAFGEIPNLLSFIISRFLMIAILYNLRKIFSTFYHNEPFDYKNVTRIKIIALYLALFPVIQLIDSLIDYSHFVNYQLASKFLFRWNFSLRSIVIPAIVYIVAEIFRYGFELKKENEEFV